MGAYSWRFLLRDLRHFLPEPFCAFDRLVRNIGSVRRTGISAYMRTATTQTYVARLVIENWRRAGVPFYPRTGKASAARKNKIAIKFKQAPLAMFGDTSIDALADKMAQHRMTGPIVNKNDASHQTVLDDPAVMAQSVAGWFVEKLGNAESNRIAVCLSGGSTPRLLYGLLTQSPYRQAIPWSRIHWFWSDERFVPPDDERSNYNMARELLLDEVTVPRENIHPVHTSSGTPIEAAAAYERELQRFYGASRLDPARPLFHVALLGVGEDGHTASLFPGSPALEERSHWAAAVVGVKPEARITLTYPTLESSRDIVFLVTGSAKRKVMQRIFGGASDLPAARLRPIGRVRWFMDRAAAP